MRLFITLLATSTVLLASFSSAQAFQMMGTTGLDLQSAGLMILCQDKAEKAIVAAEKKHNHTKCVPEEARIIPYSTKLVSLSQDKNGFIYESYVESGCSLAAKYEVEVGPSANGKNCTLLTEPEFLEVE